MLLLKATLFLSILALTATQQPSKNPPPVPAVPAVPAKPQQLPTVPTLSPTPPSPPAPPTLPPNVTPEAPRPVQLGPPTFSPSFSIASKTSASDQTAANAESSRRISKGAQQFALELFKKFSDNVHLNNYRRDFMFSPFAIWSLLLLLAEGAAGNTLKQLRTTLHLDDDQQSLRAAYRDVQKYFRIKTSTIEVAALQALFTDINQPVQREFENIMERYYGIQLFPVNFHDPNTTYHRINDEVRLATRGLIPYSVLPQDLENANLFLVSSLYFKGQWKHPFNKSLTRREPFYDEDGNSIGDVEMMVQEAAFNFAGFNELEAHVLDLPYGKQNRLSMLVILPKKGVTLNKVVHNLHNFGIEPIFEKLATNAADFEEENVEVFLPRFETMSDFVLKGLLQELGMEDIFDSRLSDLSKMSANVYVTQITHATRIIVNEEGTEAAAVVTAVLANKATPPKFYLNRPFIYLIMERSTNLLLFVGQVTNPNNFKYN